MQIRFFCPMILLIVCSQLYARDFAKGMLAWNMERQAAQAVPDVMITQNMVNAAGGTFTITSPGVYGLAEDITFTLAAVNGIVIASNDVVLNLQEHTITGAGAGTNGINISAGLQRIIITNGNILNCQGILFTGGAATQLVIIDHINCYVGTTTVTNDGINGISNGDLVVVRDCTINQGSEGIRFNSRVWLQRCFVSNSLTGYRITGQAVDCIAESCTINGFQNVGNVIFRRCSAYDCADGFFIVGGLITEYENCIAHNNSSSGFEVSSGSGSSFRNCSSYNNTLHGFLNVSANITFDHCISTTNGGDGFQNSGANVTIRACEAHNNTGTGINDLSGGVAANIMFFNNLSYGNTTQYSVNVPDQVATPVPVTNGYWINVHNP